MKNRIEKNVLKMQNRKKDFQPIQRHIYLCLFSLKRLTEIAERYKQTNTNKFSRRGNCENRCPIFCRERKK